jgi:hypothetical protein
MGDFSTEFDPSDYYVNPTGDQPDQVSRIQSLLPPWFPDWANAPIVSAVINGCAALLAFAYALLQYAKSQTRITTAFGAWLDLISYDYFGLRFPRASGESDASFQNRILKELLRPRDTRAAIIREINDITGFPARLIEPWSPGDTGNWDGFYWDVDTPTAPFRWTMDEKYQFFVETTAPLPLPFGDNPTPCYDTSGYFDASLYLIDPLPSIVGKQVVYDAINVTKAAGTTAWVKFVPPATSITWDQPGITWDQAGITWDSNT